MPPALMEPMTIVSAGSSVSPSRFGPRCPRCTKSRRKRALQVLVGVLAVAVVVVVIDQLVRPYSQLHTVAFVWKDERIREEDGRTGHMSACDPSVCPLPPPTDGIATQKTGAAQELLRDRNNSVIEAIIAEHGGQPFADALGRAVWWGSSGSAPNRLGELLYSGVSGNNVTVTLVGGSASCIEPGFLASFAKRLADFASGLNVHIRHFNPSAGATSSVWGAVELEALVPPETDVLLWEFNLNDWNGPIGALLPRRAYAQQAIELFIRRLHVLFARNSNRRIVPVLGMISLWGSDFPRCFPSCGHDPTYSSYLQVVHHYLAENTTENATENASENTAENAATAAGGGSALLRDVFTVDARALVAHLAQARPERYTQSAMFQGKVDPHPSSYGAGLIGDALFVSAMLSSNMSASGGTRSFIAESAAYYSTRTRTTGSTTTTVSESRNWVVAFSPEAAHHPLLARLLDLNHLISAYYYGKPRFGDAAVALSIAQRQLAGSGGGGGAGGLIAGRRKDKWGRQDTPWVIDVPSCSQQQGPPTARYLSYDLLAPRWATCDVGFVGIVVNVDPRLPDGGIVWNTEQTVEMWRRVFWLFEDYGRVYEVRLNGMLMRAQTGADLRGQHAGLLTRGGNEPSAWFVADRDGAAGAADRGCRIDICKRRDDFALGGIVVV